MNAPVDDQPARTGVQRSPSFRGQGRGHGNQDRQQPAAPPRPAASHPRPSTASSSCEPTT